MTAALLWKEYRDQRAVWITMIASATLFLAGTAQLADTEAIRLEVSRVVAVAFAWGYGLVCGALLLAGERESATLTFLDLLPTSRMRLWTAKGLGGVFLVVLQVMVLAVLGYWFQLAKEPPEVMLGAAVLLLTGLYGLAWGLFAGSFGRNVLNSVGMAILGQVVAFLIMSLVALLVLAFLSVWTGRSEAGFANFVAVLSYPVLLFVALLGSATVFTRPDQLRREAEPQPRRVTSRGRPAGTNRGWAALLWLSWAQAGRFVLLVAFFTASAGILLPANIVFVWPVLTLLVGTLCGVTVFADEQESGANRFLGEQRFPLGRVWLVKVGLRSGVLAAVALLSLIVGLVAGMISAAAGGRSLPQEVVPLPWMAKLLPSSLWLVIREPALFFSVWPVYGFAAGHLCGLLFRKTLVAFFAGLGLGCLLASVWAPSFLVGGLHGWQVFGVPVILLGVARLLMTSWAADRLVSWATGMRLTTAGVLVALWTAGAVAFRVVELPPGDEGRFAGFLAGFPTPEENEGGRAMRAACRRVELAQNLLNEVEPARAIEPGRGQPRNIGQRLEDTAENGWPANDTALEQGLDRAFSETWPRELAESANKPPGVLVDPRDLSFNSTIPEAQGAQAATRMLGARGLQLQAQGQPEAFVEALHSGLAVTRNLRNRSIVLAVQIARDSENGLSRRTERWLERLDGRPDLLLRALDEWTRHPGETENDDHDLAECIVQFNTLGRPAEILREVAGSFRDGNSLRLEADVLGPSWQVPWEKARLRRIVLAQVDHSLNWRALRELGPWFLENGFRSARLRQNEGRVRCRLEATRLMLALRLYQAEKGKAAEALDQLVPKYLPSVPADPFDGKPFRYRLSRGESIVWPSNEVKQKAAVPPPAAPQAQPQNEPPGQAMPAMIGIPAIEGMPAIAEPAREIPAGQGILWSVGEDRHDGGGHRQVTSEGNTASLGDQDIIFLVPLPPRH